TGTTGAPAEGPKATGGGSRPAPKAQGTPDPFDWDQPVQELPKDYGTAGAAGGAASRRTAPAATPPPPPQNPAPPPAPPPRAPSTAPEVPSLPVEPVVAPSPTAAAAAQGTSNGPRTPAARVAEARGRTAAVLADLLKAKKAQQLDIPAPSSPQEFKGPDSE